MFDFLKNKEIEKLYLVLEKLNLNSTLEILKREKKQKEEGKEMNYYAFRNSNSEITSVILHENIGETNKISRNEAIEEMVKLEIYCKNRIWFEDRILVTAPSFFQKIKQSFLEKIKKYWEDK